MDITHTSAIAGELAERIRQDRRELTKRWLDRIADRVSIEPQRIFPTEELLNHVPVLIAGIADYLEDPSDEISADAPVIAKAMELGELRFSQGFDATEILKEYEILGGVLFAYGGRVMAEYPDCSNRDLMTCAHRLFRAISVIEQVTTGQYLRALGERVGEREERLRRFSRMITHELKNRVGATLGAGQLLQEDWLGDAERRRFAGMVADNAQEIQKVLENLSALSKLDRDTRRQRNVLLPDVIDEVFRQLRELARGREVELRVDDDTPRVEVNAAAVELCLSNYLSNAIKYSDPDRPDRWARVAATLDEPDADGMCELVIRVIDNGQGVPEDRRERLFERFYRAHEHLTGVEGTGLGLNLVQETVESLGGRAWAEFDAEQGATFAFSLPCRRAEDAESADDGDAASAAHAGSDTHEAGPADDAPATGDADLSCGVAAAPGQRRNPAGGPRGTGSG